MVKGGKTMFIEVKQPTMVGKCRLQNVNRSVLALGFDVKYGQIIKRFEY